MCFATSRANRGQERPLHQASPLFACPLPSFARREPPICQDHVFRIASNQAFPPATALIWGFPASLPLMFESPGAQRPPEEGSSGDTGTECQTNMSSTLGGPGWITNAFCPSYRALWRFRLPGARIEGRQTNRCHGRCYQLLSNPPRGRPMTDWSRPEEKGDSTHDCMR